MDTTAMEASPALKAALASAVARAVLNATGGSVQKSLLSATEFREAQNGAVIAENFITPEAALDAGMNTDPQAVAPALRLALQRELQGILSLALLTKAGGKIEVQGAGVTSGMRKQPAAVALSSEVGVAVAVRGLQEPAEQRSRASFVAGWEKAILENMGTPDSYLLKTSLATEGQGVRLATALAMDPANAADVAAALKAASGNIREALSQTLTDIGLAGTGVDVGAIGVTGVPSTSQEHAEAVLAGVEKDVLEVLAELRFGSGSSATTSTPTGNVFALALRDLVKRAGNNTKEVGEGKGQQIALPLPASLGMEILLPQDFFTSNLLGAFPEDTAAVVKAFNGSQIKKMGSANLEVVAAVAIEFRALDGKPLNVSALPTPVEFTIPASFQGGMQCRFWDVEKGLWSSKGMAVSAKSAASSDLRCETVHFSFFGAILEGIMQTLACANFDILNAEGIANIFKGDWYMGWAGIVCGFLLLLLAVAMGVAAYLDLRRIKKLGWRDEFFLVETGPLAPLPQGEGDAPSDELQEEAAAPEPTSKTQKGAAAAMGGCACICGWMKESSGVAEALEDICSSYFEYFGEVRGALEECAGMFSGLGGASCGALLYKTAAHMLLRRARESTAMSMGISDDLLEFVMEDEDLREFLIKSTEQRVHAVDAPETAHNAGRAGEWRLAKSQHDVWHLLHDEVSHRLVQHSSHEHVRGSMLLVPFHIGKTFLRSNPLGAAYTLDLFKSCKQRVFLVALEFWGALALCCVFYEASGEVSVSGKKKDMCDVEESGDLAEAIGMKIGRTIVIATVSIIVASLPLCFLESLQTKGFKKLEQRNSKAWKKQLKAWVIQERIFWTFGLVYLAFCVFYVVVFIANIDIDDQAGWSIQGLITILQDFIAMPLCSCLVVGLFTTACLKVHDCVSGNHPAAIHRDATLLMLSSSSNMVLPITQV